MHHKNQFNVKKLFLLDGMALIYRAYFALSRNPRVTSYGLNTSAVFGFTNTLLDVLNNQRPTHIAAVFDTDKPTIRHLEYEDYKAHREAMPEDLAASIPYIFRLLEGFHIPVITKDGYEADDIIGTLAKKAETVGFETYCMTPDKDFAQLVSEKIHLYKPARMGFGAEVIQVNDVLKKWEVENVSQVIDILGLWGDAVDNIPGVPGIGEKTAKKLIKEYGSIEGILENTDKLKGKQKENLENFADQALISKKLATILLDVPVDFDAEELILKDYNQEALESLFVELEFRTLGKRIFGESFSVAGGQDPSGQMNLFAQNTADTSSAPSGSSPSSIEIRNIESVKPRYELIEDIDGVKALSKLLIQADAFAFDTETSDLDVYRASLVGISVALRKENAHYIHFDENKERTEEILALLEPAFTNPKSLKIGHNAKYDIQVLKNNGIEVKGPLFDTMVAHYLLDADTRHNMDTLSETYLNYTPIPIETLIGPRGKNQKSMRDLSDKVIMPYACEDADVTWQLYECFLPLLKEAHVLELAENVEFPLIYVLANMESNGVKLDVAALKSLSEKLQTVITEIENTIYEKTGVTFNISSPKQLGEVLFDHLKLDPKAKKTKTGQYKTGEDVLLGLASKSDIVQDILEYRQIKKLLSTYVLALPELINQSTGLIHTSYNQAITSTGRLSSTHPNLQNIPIRTELGREVRKAFVPRDPDNQILSADYSQIELRIMAELSDDANMKEAFEKGLDIHRATAARVYGVELEEVTSEQRRNAKAVNFGIIYGQSAFGLSQSLGISRKEAADIIKQYFKQYQGIQNYMSQIVEEAKEKGYVETILKRRRYLRDINSANRTVQGYAERNAINAPIQGSAADMIKVAMIDIQKELDAQKLKSKMIMQVHDELVFDVPKTEAEIVKKIINEKMTQAIPLSIPLIVDIGAGENWLEAH